MTHKVASTPQNQSIGVMQGIQELCNLAAMPLADISQVLHGTTVATNIMIEKSGATVGMIRVIGIDKTTPFELRVWTGGGKTKSRGRYHHSQAHLL